MTAVAFQAPAREPTARAIDRRKIVRTSSDVARPLEDAPRLPVTRIHPLAIWTPLAAYSWLILAACATFAGGATSLVLAFVVLISVMFLSGMALPAFMGRNMEPEREQDRSFRAFWNGEADIATGRISGRAAFWQVGSLAIALAIGGTAILVVAHMAAVAAGPTI